MERLLASLERRFGKFAIPNLPLFVVVGTAIAFVLGMLRPDFLSLLTLDIAAVRRGEVWRLVSYLFIPRTNQLIWILFELNITWLVGTSLESEWGAFKLNVFYLLGMIGTTIAAWITGGNVGNQFLNASMALGFATLFPEFQIYVFFFIPLRMKWAALLLAGFLAFEALEGSWAMRAATIVALGNYLLFFGEHLYALVRHRRVLVRQAARRADFRAEPARRASEPPPSGLAGRGAVTEVAEGALAMGARTCAICGAAEADGADIRVCSCAKCGGKPRTLCLEHARAH